MREAQVELPGAPQPSLQQLLQRVSLHYRAAQLRAFLEAVYGEQLPGVENAWVVGMTCGSVIGLRTGQQRLGAVCLNHEELCMEGQAVKITQRIGRREREREREAELYMWKE